jgi:hypothetical protein
MEFLTGTGPSVLAQMWRRKLTALSEGEAT